MEQEIVILIDAPLGQGCIESALRLKTLPTPHSTCTIRATKGCDPLQTPSFT